MNRRSAWLLAAIVVAGLAAWTSGGDAQQSDRDVPLPTECQVPPRTLESLQALATPEPLERVGLEASPTALPPGDPLDAESLAAITATARQVIACENAGEPWRALALYSDRFLSQYFSEPGVFTPERYAMLATPRPVAPADQQIALVAVADGRLLADGRAGATVTVNDPSSTEGGDTASFLFFTEQDGQWLVDSAVELPTTPAGTPTSTG